MSTKINYTPEFDNFITKNIDKLSSDEMGEALGCSRHTINKRIKYLHLWSEHLAFSEKKAKTQNRYNGKGNLGELAVVARHEKKKRKDFYLKRQTTEGKKLFWKYASSLGYDARHTSKVVFITSKTKRSIRFEQRLRNEFPDYQLKDLSYLSNLKHEEN